MSNIHGAGLWRKENQANQRLQREVLLASQWTPIWLPYKVLPWQPLVICSNSLLVTSLFVQSSPATQPLCFHLMFMLFFFPPLSDLCTGCAPCLEFLPYYIILHFTDSFRSSFSLHHHSLLNVFPPYIKSSISINPMHLSLKITDSSLHVVLELFNSPVCLS